MPLRDAQPKRGHRAFIFTGCFLFLVVLGWVDYLTGYELGFFVFYSVPVGLAAWHLGRWPGVAVALGATISWWLADAFAGVKYSSRFSFWWNSAVHFSAFVINAVTIAKIRSDLIHRDKLVVLLEATRQTLRAAASVLPACPLCGKTHPQAAPSAKAELRDFAQGNADLRGTGIGDPTT
jgi:hypothetical protein